MMDKKHIKKAEKIVKEFFKKITLEVDFEIKLGEADNTLDIDLKTEEPQVLIGKGGATLSDVQSLLGRILRKQLGEELYVNLDINQYKESKIQYLKELAHEVADEVALNKSVKEMPQMNSFERRVVHMELAERSDVNTDSQGQGFERRVIVKPS